MAPCTAFQMPWTRPSRKRWPRRRCIVIVSNIFRVPLALISSPQPPHGKREGATTHKSYAPKAFRLVLSSSRRLTWLNRCSCGLGIVSRLCRLLLFECVRVCILSRLRNLPKRAMSEVAHLFHSFRTPHARELLACRWTTFAPAIRRWT